MVGMISFKKKETQNNKQANKHTFTITILYFILIEQNEFFFLAEWIFRINWSLCRIIALQELRILPIKITKLSWTKPLRSVSAELLVC